MALYYLFPPNSAGIYPSTSSVPKITTQMAAAIITVRAILKCCSVMLCPVLFDSQLFIAANYSGASHFYT